MSNICTIAKIWIKMDIFTLLLHIYPFSLLSDFLQCPLRHALFQYKHSKILKNLILGLFAQLLGPYFHRKMLQFYA